jgi:hypothetical protein
MLIEQQVLKRAKQLNFYVKYRVLKSCTIAELHDHDSIICTKTSLTPGGSSLEKMYEQLFKELENYNVQQPKDKLLDVHKLPSISDIYRSLP